MLKYPAISFDPISSTTYVHYSEKRSLCTMKCSKNLPCFWNMKTYWSFFHHRQTVLLIFSCSQGILFINWSKKIMRKASDQVGKWHKMKQQKGFRNSQSMANFEALHQADHFIEHKPNKTPYISEVCVIFQFLDHYATPMHGQVPGQAIASAAEFIYGPAHSVHFFCFLFILQNNYKHIQMK